MTAARAMQPADDALASSPFVQAGELFLLRRPERSPHEREIERLRAQVGAAEREAAVARAELERLRPPPTPAARKKARNAAIGRALRLVEAGSPSGRAKELERQLRAYASNGWPRERDLATLPAGSSELRRAWHQILRLNNGKALSWSWLLKKSREGLH
jgi:hypothetical protein